MIEPDLDRFSRRMWDERPRPHRELLEKYKEDDLEERIERQERRQAANALIRRQADPFRGR